MCTQQRHGIEYMQHEHGNNNNYGYYYVHGCDCAKHVYTLFDLKHEKCDAAS